MDAFANHTKLEWLELANCYALSEVALPESVTEIGIRVKDRKDGFDWEIE